MFAFFAILERNALKALTSDHPLLLWDVLNTGATATASHQPTEALC